MIPTDPTNYPQAYPNVEGDCYTVDPTSPAFRQGVKDSRNSPRKRIILPIHRTQEDLVQRMLNFFQPGTYVRAHCHPLNYAIETIFIIQGRLGFVEYDSAGAIKATYDLQAGSLIDIVPRLYHSMVALDDDTVVLEVKRGPYTNDDKIFSEWSPADDSTEAAQLVQDHEKLFLR